MRTRLTSVLAAALAAGALLAAPATARPVDGTQMRANAGAAEPQPTGGGDDRQPKTWLIVIAGLAGATIAAGGSAGAHRGHRLA